MRFERTNPKDTGLQPAAALQLCRLPILKRLLIRSCLNNRQLSYGHGRGNAFMMRLFLVWLALPISHHVAVHTTRDLRRQDLDLRIMESKSTVLTNFTTPQYGVSYEIWTRTKCLEGTYATITPMIHIPKIDILNEPSFYVTYLQIYSANRELNLSLGELPQWLF